MSRESIINLCSQCSTRNFEPPPDPEAPKKMEAECPHIRLISSLNPFEHMVLNELLQGEIYQLDLEHKLHCSSAKLTRCILKLSTLEKHPCYFSDHGKMIMLGCL